jgi:uncharacterized membrane protein YfcA
MGSQVFGNLLAAFVLGYLPQKFFVIIILAVLILSSGLLFALKQPIIHHIENSNTQAVGSGDTEKVTLKQGLSKLWDLCKDRRFRWIIPQSSFTGISIAYFSGNLVEMLEFYAPFNP